MFVSCVYILQYNLQINLGDKTIVKKAIIAIHIYSFVGLSVVFTVVIICEH